ncbi:MAG: DUF2863 family protein [Proteobacteria bacterium]|nr:DUF2863 family protein [Pseudomonadota bacterium]
MPLPEKKCPGCGIEFRHDPRITFEFCPDCGAKMPESREQQPVSPSKSSDLLECKAFVDAAINALMDDHVQNNSFRLGILGSQNINNAVHHLRMAAAIINDAI